MDNGVLYILCTFMIGSDNGGCFIEMRMISGSEYTALHIGCSNRENIVTGCITNLETGIYNIDIFDINNNGQKDSSGTAVTISTMQVFPPSQPRHSTSTHVSTTMYDNIRETPNSTVSYKCHVICHVMDYSVLNKQD